MAYSSCAIGDGEQFVHLCLRGTRPAALVQDDEDWQALAAVLRRMLFWCGGWIHGCRCEGNEIRLALQQGQAALGTMAHHVSAPYAKHLGRRRGWTGRVFGRYTVTPLDGDVFLDDLVIWLHRPPPPAADEAERRPCWTAAAAYMTPNSLPWITTERVLAALSPGGAGRSAYLRRMLQPVDSGVVFILTGRAARRRGPLAAGRWSVEAIARFVADYSHVSYEGMRSLSRRRPLSQARAIATVLSARYGWPVSAVARLFGRSRSTLIERAESYRQIQPEVFAHAERALTARIGAEQIDPAHPRLAAFEQHLPLGLMSSSTA